LSLAPDCFTLRWQLVRALRNVLGDGAWAQIDSCAKGLYSLDSLDSF